MKISGKSILNFSFAFLFICVLLPLSGCAMFGSSSSKTDYYTLEYDSPKLTGLNVLPFIIKIERFYASPLYNSEKISYRKSDFQTDEYNYDRWETNPAQLIAYFLYRDIKQSGFFKGVFSHDTGYAATHSVSGTVDEFYEDDRGKVWEAVLSLDIVLMAENEPDINKRILFQKKYSARKPCAKKNPKAVAEAMSKAMSELSGQIITDIHKSLSGKI
ncbi:MAG: ABC-type transport auxiliary lipoprotein family protein [Desulfobacterales bacterium]|nr:ABC-type transport auxiliary lipoprotein family protein [Desulfobacterales bacterium]